MRRYGWSNGNISANGNCVLLETEHHPGRGTSSYLRRPQEDLSTDSCGENIRYQAVEGLVQTTRHKMAPNSHLLRAASTPHHAQYSSSMENLLSDRSRGTEDNSTLSSTRPAYAQGLVKYGSTGSIDSIGSTSPFDTILGGPNSGIRAATYTPSSLYSQDSTSVPTMYFGKMSSTESMLIYDAIPKPSGGSTSLKKSNSRVSSTGKLRLRVESFRNNKSSSGTQTDISVMKSKEGVEAEPKYTGQYKKNTAPNKPARKHKPSKVNEANANGESRSDRSASPDGNSSTSGYSSPSAGLHSKESSPCGSKIPSPPHSLEQEDGHTASKSESSNDEELRPGSEDNNRITVIQIDDKQTEEESSEESSNGSADSHLNLNSSNGHMNGRQSQNHNRIESKTLPLTRPTRRELPRIVTNGTLGRPQPQPPQKRKLPETRAAQDSRLQVQPAQAMPPVQRIYRSNLPRPAPIHQFGPGGRVPLPPVPELERSDHERESMSPTPSSSSAMPSPRFRPLPSPLTTPVQPSARGQQRRTNTLSPSRIPALAQHHMPGGQQHQRGVEERLRILLSLLESGKEDAKNGREDTLQYLSQLESVARRLKDQLLNDNFTEKVLFLSAYAPKRMLHVFSFVGRC